MPDLTLYRDDIEDLREIVVAFRSLIRWRLGEVVSSSDLVLCAESERLSDLLLDRLVQNLHPERTPSVTDTDTDTSLV